MSSRIWDGPCPTCGKYSLDCNCGLFDSKENESKKDHENRQLVYELTGIRDESMHIKPYADMIEKMSYVQKADFAKAALDYERDAKTLKQMLEEVSRERDGWISEYRAARAEVERLKQRLSEVEDDYEDICKLTYDVAVPCRREWLIEQVGEENWERFKNHMGW